MNYNNDNKRGRNSWGMKKSSVKTNNVKANQNSRGGKAALLASKNESSSIINVKNSSDSNNKNSRSSSSSGSLNISSQAKRTNNSDDDDEVKLVEVMKEPTHLKVLYAFSGVFPLLKNAQQDTSKVMIAFTLLYPMLVWIFNAVLLFIHICSVIKSPLASPFENGTNYHPSLTQNLAGISLYLFLFFVQYGLYKTRNNFLKSISNLSREKVNILSRRSVIITFVGGFTLGTFMFVFYLWTNDLPTDEQHHALGVFIQLTFVIFTIIPIFGTINVVLSRVRFYSSVYMKKYNKLDALAKGADANALHHKCVLTKKKATEDYVLYLKAPLSVCFTLAVLLVFFNMISIYLDKTHGPGPLLYMILFGLMPLPMVILPLFTLMKLDARSAVLKEAICQNIQMKRVDLTALLLTFEMIVPRIKVFGMYVTINLVASAVIPLVGALIPKLIRWIMLMSDEA